MTSIGSTFLILTRDKAPHKIEVRIKPVSYTHLTTEAVVANKPEPAPAAPAMDPSMMGGMM